MAEQYFGTVKVSTEDTTDILIAEEFMAHAEAYAAQWERDIASELGIKMESGKAGQKHLTIPTTKLDATVRAEGKDALSKKIPRGGAHVTRRTETITLAVDDTQAEVIENEGDVMAGNPMEDAMTAAIAGANRYRTSRLIAAFERVADRETGQAGVVNIGGSVCAGYAWDVSTSSGRIVNKGLLVPTAAAQQDASSFNSGKLTAMKSVLAANNARRMGDQMCVVMPYQGLFDYVTAPENQNRDIRGVNMGDGSPAERAFMMDDDYMRIDAGVKLVGIPGLGGQVPYFNKFAIGKGTVANAKRTFVSSAGARTDEVDATLKTAVTAGTNDIGAYRAYMFPSHAVCGYMAEGPEGGISLELKIGRDPNSWNGIQIAAISRVNYFVVVPEHCVQSSFVPNAPVQLGGGEAA